MPRAFLDDLQVITVGGTTLVDKILGFFANTVFVENYTSQWVFVAGLSFVPPYTSRLIGVGGVQRARIQFGTPPGVVQVASIAGQICNSTWSERDVPQLGGAVGPIGVTSNYYDRNAVPAALGFGASGVAPHASTIRQTYTVPANRKAFVQRVLTSVMRDAVAAPAGLVLAYSQYFPSSGTSPVVTVAELLTNAVGDKDKDSMSGVGHMAAGDKIQLVTSDASTGGTVRYDLGMWWDEFDA